MEDRAEKLIRKYAAGDPETRVDIICKNYSNFERFIDADWTFGRSEAEVMLKSAEIIKTVNDQT